jgi:acyl carrier protein
VDTIEAELIEQLKEKFGGQPKLDDTLLLIGVDSVGMAELTLEIEKQFHVRVDDAILDVETVQELADYVRQLQSAKVSKSST